MINGHRKSGIAVIGDIAWGTHLCHFYQTQEELIDILVPYFKAGLEDNEFCTWVTSEPLGTEQAKESLRKEVTNLDDYIEKGQMEILDVSEWYTISGKFDPDKGLQGWVEKEKLALEKGFDGLRLTGNTFWLEPGDWQDFAAYEEQVNSVIGRYRMIAICSYSLDRCGASEIINVVCNHQFALIRQAGDWVIMESSERNRVDQKARESEERYRTLFEQKLEGVLVIGEAMKVLLANQAAADMFGFDSVEEAHEVNIFDYIAPEGRERALIIITQDMFGNDLRQVNEFRCMKKSGQEIWVGAVGSVIEYQGEIAGLISFRDITERKRAEEALKESEENLRTYLESAPDGVYLNDLKGTFLYGNKKAEQMVGYGREELVGKNFLELNLLPEEYLEKAAKLLEANAMGRPTGPDEFELTRKDGTRVWVEINTAPIKQREEVLVIGFVRDITERKKMEEERQRAVKLESVGVLAGGIAHDFNNLLTGIMGNIGLAKRYVDPKEKAFDRLLEAEKASLRARDLTQQLLTFAKGGTPVKRIASIAELIKDSATFALRGSNVRCEFCLPNGLWAVEVDEGQISQGISNLVINADEAMPEGGIINISAENTAIRTGSPLPLRKGKYIEITLEDHGTGIRKEHLGRIFDPYFTTKQRGSGLGLATTYSIIKKHNGYITTDSKLAVGTTFHVYLPASEKPISVKREVIVEDTLVNGKGRILIMDDEEIIRELLLQELSDAGYEVQLTKDGAEAIVQYTKAKKSGKPFDAVIMDATIPGGMGGKEAIQKLLEIDPEVEVIVSSGYANDSIIVDFRDYGFREAIAKPYKITELEKTLHSVVKRAGD